MTASIPSMNNVQTVPTPVIQNNNVIKRKKSQAPAIGAIVGAGVGAVRVARSASSMKPIIETLNKISKGSGWIGACLSTIIACGITAAEGAGIGAIVSLFTRKAREEAAIEEYYAQFDQNV